MVDSLAPALAIRRGELVGSLRNGRRFGGDRLLCYERLEQRRLLASDMDLTMSPPYIVTTFSSPSSTFAATLDQAGNLTISDVSITISRVGSDLVIADANHAFASAAAGDALNATTEPRRIPLASVAGSLMIDGGAGDDVLTIDFSGGNPIPAGGIYFRGGEGVGDIDALRVIGYSLSNIDGMADVSVVHTGPESGSVSLAGLGTIHFAEIEPLTLVGDAANIVISLPTGADSITLGDDGVPQDANGNTANTSALYDSTGPAYSFELTEFTNPSNSLTVLRGSASDNLTILDLVSSGFSASLTAGTTTNRFVSANILGAVTLASTKTLSLYAGSITSSGPITTSGGAITLDANNGITLTKPILSNGGVQTLQADSDGDGTGTLSLNLPIAQLIDPNPAAGNQFGASVVVLTSGNVVVSSPRDDYGGTDAGAVYLFNDLTGALISTLRGSSANNNVGSGGIGVLSNGNYVVLSPNWDNGAATDAGAVTWGSGTTGLSGGVSNANSVVGNSANAVPSSGIAVNANLDTLIARFPTDGSGRVVVGSQSQGFGAIVGSLNAGSVSISISAADANILGAVTSTRSVSIAPQQNNRPIDLATNTAGTLGLTDAELDQVTAGTLVIGRSVANASGNVAVSNSITRSSSTNVQLLTGGDIVISGSGQINTNGGTLLLDAGNSPAAVKPTSTGTDVTASSLSVDGDLAISINGATVNTQYTQLNVNGAVSLTGVGLQIIGSFPAITGNETFTIVSATSVTGTFTGLANNAPIAVHGKPFLI